MEMPPKDAFVEAAIDQARRWLTRANQLMTAEERTVQKQLQRLLENPADKTVMTKMIDQSFRSRDDKRVADQINAIFEQHGVPEFFSSSDKILMRLFLGIGRHFPHVAVPRVVQKMREDSSRSVIPGEAEELYPYLEKRKSEGVIVNINHLGEAVLSESEALKRLETYEADLRNPEIAYISVKISTIYSQISSLAFEHCVAILEKRLARLFRAARDHDYHNPDGSRRAKFVNLDMEEYRDLEITAAVFTRTLDAEEFNSVRAGIVLQAYLPDSFAMQQRLTDWARKRVDAGGSPIKIRIVKGANMEMEQIDAALHNWPLAPYDNKLDVDANYKRMLAYGLQPKNIRGAHLGIASHNLFDLAYAYCLAQQSAITQGFSFEMLEGMADHVRRALQETDEEMVLYAPVATREQFLSAIAYLIRRLDENTAEDNFLRYACHLSTDSNAWEFLKNQFIAACEHQERAGTQPHRIQNRNTETSAPSADTYFAGEFSNEPDTDFSLACNRRWAQSIRDRWMIDPGSQPMRIPVVVAGHERFEDHAAQHHFDINRIGQDHQSKICIAVSARASETDIERAVAVARLDPDGWRQTSIAQRHGILTKVAAGMRRTRADLIGAAMAETGKVMTQADPEVSEAVDFAEFYAHCLQQLGNRQNLTCSGKGVGVVISPWNFPIAIPCGGITAALAAGNTVIFKPASSAVVTAWQLCRVFWKAGISRNTLQFVPCTGSKGGDRLSRHTDVDFVIFTGGTDTGRRILFNAPQRLLAAETGGKNATIVTAMSDHGQAITDILDSAFGHCGQKCSATSLLILEREVYRDEHFKHSLTTAAQSLAVGSAWQFQNKMGPLITPPQGDLKRALTRLEEGEHWVLEPRQIGDNPHLWSPGIKYGVRPGSYTHVTEFFGPVLGVMEARNLEQAIDQVNQSGYGLTTGLESLDIREQATWQAGVRAGNLYINRGTTGAVVLRQPFGGMGKSALGAGIKAGGPNYVTQFMEIHDNGWPPTGVIARESRLLRLMQAWEQRLRWGRWRGNEEEIEKTIRAVKSYLYNAQQEFSRPKDYFHLRGQDNLCRYLPLGTICVRVQPRDGLFETLARMAAVTIAGSQLVISAAPELDNPVTRFLAAPQGKYFRGKTPITRQSDDQLIAAIPRVQGIRYAAPDRVPQAVYRAAAEGGFFLARAPVLMDGRLELLWYYREQSICNNYHRYGNLGERSLLLDGS